MVVEGRINGGGRHLLNLRTSRKGLDTTHIEAYVDIEQAGSEKSLIRRVE